MNMERDAQKAGVVLRPAVIVFASFGLAFLFSMVFAVIACFAGFLFSGLGVLFTVLCAIFFSAIATIVSTVLFKQPLRCFGWRIIWAEVAIFALVSTSALSWISTRQQLGIFMRPMTVPDSVHVKRGRQVLFGSFVHFSASPADIAALIQSKELVEVPDWSPDGNTEMPQNFSERERAKKAWDWWQPAALSEARFYLRLHKSNAPQGWLEGWWVNGKTNEVFAYISR